jgi:hypothetical protein
VTAYATAVGHDATSLKQITEACLQPPKESPPETTQKFCDAASSGYDALVKSKTQLQDAITK